MPAGGRWIRTDENAIEDIIFHGIPRQRGGRTVADEDPVGAIVGAGVARQRGGRPVWMANPAQPLSVLVLPVSSAVDPRRMTIPFPPFWRTVLWVTVAVAFTVDEHPAQAIAFGEIVHNRGARRD